MMNPRKILTSQNHNQIMRNIPISWQML